MANADSSGCASPAPPQQCGRWIFCGIELNEATLELRVRGRPVPIERKPLEVLRLLLHRRGEVVRKEDFFQIVWKGRVLSDAALTKSMAVLRKAIGDSRHDIIRTLHGYGYRLVPAARLVRGEPLCPGDEREGSARRGTIRAAKTRAFSRRRRADEAAQMTSSAATRMPPHSSPTSEVPSSRTSNKGN